VCARAALAACFTTCELALPGVRVSIDGAVVPAAALAEVNKGSEMFSAGFKDDDNPYVWDVTIFGPPNTPYESGLFKAEMIFPLDYPNMPPKMSFISDLWHPNIYPDGRVCISILHPPGEDAFGYESTSERWRPIHTAESILLSVISMLADPNSDSPANIDAAKQFREEKAEFMKRVKRCVRKSQDE